MTPGDPMARALETAGDRFDAARAEGYAAGWSAGYRRAALVAIAAYVALYLCGAIS